MTRLGTALRSVNSPLSEAGLTPTAFVKRGTLAEPFIWDYATRLTSYRAVLAADGFGGPVDWPEPSLPLGGGVGLPRIAQRAARVLTGEEGYPLEWGPRSPPAACARAIG